MRSTAFGQAALECGESRSIMSFMQEKVLSVAVAGIGGYGRSYLQALLNCRDVSIRLIGCVDPEPQRCPDRELLASRDIPIFPDLQALYQSSRPTLLVLATPPHTHCEQTCFALNRGSHVLCEKPISSTAQQAQQMIRAPQQSGRLLAIGYQWAFAPRVHKLKADIAAGRLGRPMRLSTLVCWPRGRKYYTRNNWAGRIATDDGQLVYDSPVNNACAHYVQNLLYLLGDQWNTSDWPETVQAELYRAHPIENYDTAMVRCRTRRQVELLVFVSHATRDNTSPQFRFEFEQGVITSGGATEWGIRGRLNDGRDIDYGQQPVGDDMEKLWQTIRNIRQGTPSACGPAAAAPQTAFMFAAQQSPKQIVNFPASQILTTDSADDRSTVVRGLQETMERCFADGKLPSELKVSWAQAGRPVIVRDLEKYEVTSTGSGE